MGYLFEINMPEVSDFKLSAGIVYGFLKTDLKENIFGVLCTDWW